MAGAHKIGQARVLGEVVTVDAGFSSRKWKICIDCLDSIVRLSARKFLRFSSMWAVAESKVFLTVAWIIGRLFIANAVVPPPGAVSRDGT